MNEKLMATGNALVGHCRNGTEAEALKTLYHPEVVSVEPMAQPGQDSAEVHGLAALAKKHEDWHAAFEQNSAELTGPYFHGTDRFGIIFTIDATQRETGQHFHATEFGIYTIDAEGLIVREEFFFNPMMM